MSVNASRQIDAILESVIREQGGTYPVTDARNEMAQVLREARADCEAHGADPDEPFFCFSISGGVAVFTVYRDDLDIYVVPCDQLSEFDLIPRFERLALVDIAEAVQILRTVYGKQQPDLSINSATKHDWLYGQR